MFAGHVANFFNWFRTVGVIVKSFEIGSGIYELKVVCKLLMPQHFGRCIYAQRRETLQKRGGFCRRTHVTDYRPSQQLEFIINVTAVDLVIQAVGVDR